MATHKTRQRLPKGWTLERIEAVRRYYENQTEDEEAAEIDAMFARGDQTLMMIPTRLVPQVRKLIAADQSAARPRTRRARRVA